jgi:1-deoxy-D-xylulose-5-phosphate synthase
MLHQIRRWAPVSLLDRIEGPNDLRKLSADQLPELAEEIRAVSRRSRSRAPAATSDPNLGVVELTMAIHRVFDSPTTTRSSSTPDTSPMCTSCSPVVRTSPGCGSQGGLSGYPEPRRVRA